MSFPPSVQPESTVSLRGGARPSGEQEASEPKAEAATPRRAAGTPREEMTRLLRKTRAVPTISAAAAPAQTDTPAAAAPEQTCPNCKSKLVNPDSFGLCPACGYCRSLEDSDNMPAEPPVRQDRAYSPFGSVEFWQLFVKLPVWLYVFLAGTALIVSASVIADASLPADTLSRALWCTIQAGLGLILAVVAHEWALLLVVPQDERIGAQDAVLFSARVWKLTLKRMPATRGPVCLAAWGFVLIISAVLLIGGLYYWLPKAHKFTAIHQPSSSLQTHLS